jgi:hypothetical protein
MYSTEYNSISRFRLYRPCNARRAAHAHTHTPPGRRSSESALDFGAGDPHDVEMKDRFSTRMLLRWANICLWMEAIQPIARKSCTYMLVEEADISIAHRMEFNEEEHGLSSRSWWRSSVSQPSAEPLFPAEFLLLLLSIADPVAPSLRGRPSAATVLLCRMIILGAPHACIYDWEVTM